ncbi:MAG: hypothetical protein IJH63_00225 [Methanobrevibacter sp.]|nr:hypothetical protein [Methanosphaera sp.]MBR0369129.1 hypothetical protein [Methanobrevibacter sp.]
MIDWETEEKILNLRNEISRELKLSAMSYTDFNRFIVIEDGDGLEELVQVKEVTFEAEPNTRVGAVERIIHDFTERLGWEYVSTFKQSWVDSCILYHIYFKF